ncbi:MAG: hypothetical protein RJS97_08675 [Parvibaculaceae bacterium]
MTTTPFLKPRITGTRFTGGAIPLEFLADLAVLSEMIQEVAKWKYREENPTRQRVPRGFSDGVSLKLTGVEDGSAIPVISLVVSAAMLLPPEAEQYFHEARESVVNAVFAAQEGREITDHLPQKLLGYFDRFGRNLAEGEAIELPSATTNLTARLTRDVRRKLVVASSATHYTEEASVYGLVHEFDQRAKTFQLTLPEGNILQRIPVESQHYDAILEANNGYRNQQRVRLTGVGRYDLNGRLLELISVEHVVPVDPLDVGIRIEELKQLQPGWLDGKGEALDADGLQWLVEAFATQFADDATLPYLFPTPEGNVLAEWSLGPNSVSLEIDLRNRSAEWHVLNVDTDHEDTGEFDLNSATDWERIAANLRAIGGAAE